MSYRTNAAGMCVTANDCVALIDAVRSQPDDPAGGNALRDACRRTAFVILERRERDFTFVPVGSALRKLYRVVEVVPAALPRNQ